MMNENKVVNKILFKFNQFQYNIWFEESIEFNMAASIVLIGASVLVMSALARCY